MLQEPVENFEAQKGVEILGGGSCLRLNSSVYSPELVMRTAYWYTDCAYIYITKDPTDSTFLQIFFRSKKDNLDLNLLAHDFLNSLLDQAVRKQVELETHVIREIIVKKAFSEALSAKEQTLMKKLGE